MKSVLVRVGPAYSSSLILAGNVARRTLYDRMETLPGRVAPVLIDHDEELVIGEVVELFRMRHADFGGSTWLMARLRVHDPPAWLRRGGAVSLGHRNLHVWQVDGWEIVRRGIVDEVSLLSPGVEPVERGARVELVDDYTVAGYRMQPGDVELAPTPRLRRQFETTFTVR